MRTMFFITQFYYLVDNPLPTATSPPLPVVKSKWELVENGSSDEEKEQKDREDQSSSYNSGKKKEESLKEQQKRQFLRDVEVS